VYKGVKMEKREYSILRKTEETEIKLRLNLDGQGRCKVQSGIGFFDHMLTLFSKHGLFDLDLEIKGDLDVDGHHSVEDAGICLGQAFRQALGDCKGINRYASCLLPMDEALCQMATDISNRPHLTFSVPLKESTVGGFSPELLEEFLQAFVSNARITLHVNLLAGKNQHHIIESCFKALGRCLDQATFVNGRQQGVPSTKGVL